MSTMEGPDNINNNSLAGNQSSSDAYRGADLLHSFVEFRVTNFLQLYMAPVLVALGVLGNITAFVTFLRGSRTMKSTDMFLCVLSAVDTLVLVTGLFRLWLVKVTGSPVLDGFDFGCTMVNFILYTATLTSVWLIVAVTYDRFLAVKHPLYMKTHCTFARAARVTIIILGAAVGVNAHFLFTLESVQEDGTAFPSCQPVPTFQSFVLKVWPWIDAALYSILPVSFVVVLNPLILYRLKTVKHRVFNRNAYRSTGQRQRLGHSTQVCVMLLVVSSAFVVSTLPMSGLLVWQTFWEADVPIQTTAGRLLLRTIAELLMYFHHAANFYLYCVSSRQFREQLYRLMFGKKRHAIEVKQEEIKLK